MANADTPFGLRPLRHRNGAPYNGAMNPYYKNSDYGTAMFVGDCVTKQGDSNAAVVTAPGAGSFNVQTLPEVKRTTAGDSNSDAERITGVVVGFGANPDNLSTVYSPASKEAVVWVCDDPDVVFEIQCDTAVAVTQMQLNGILIETHAGSTSTGLSGVELDGGSGTALAANASFQLMILRGVNREDNDVTLVHAKLEVMISTHTEASGMNTNAIGTLGQAAI
jgi:hypothetical protein